MSGIFKKAIIVAILIVCNSLRYLHADEVLNENFSNDDDKFNKLVYDSIEEFNPRQILEEISEKEKIFEELVLRFPEINSVLPLWKFGGGYLGDRNTSSTNSTRCGTDLKNLGSSLTQQWAIPLIDSYGKPASGILRGNSFWTGNYDQCLSFEAPKTNLFPSGFKGRYCIAKIKFKNFSMAIETAICVPNSCDTADLNDLNITNYLNKITNMKNLVKTLPDISVNCLPEFTPLNTASVVFIVLVSIVTALLLVGTGYDAYVRYNSCSKSSEKLTNGEASSANNSQPINDERQLVVVRKKTWIGEFLMCFSVWKNGESLLDTSIKPGQLNCIHGIRFISMTWIILGHTYVSRVGVVGNLLDVLGQFNNLPFMTIIGGQYSVDTFFFLSGFLLSYLFLKDKNTFTLKKLGDFYIHRYIRLTPVYMVVLFALASLYNFIGDGPVWMYQDRKSNLCIKYWWRNILYMNNLFPGSENCCSWSWYLANDMQFYIISPLFLVLMKSKSRKWRYVGLAIVLALLLTTWITTIIIVIVNQFRADLNTNALATGDLYNKIYNKPWTRIGPYLIGCLLGYVMVNFKDKRRLFLTRYWNILWWSSAVGLALVVVYGVFKANFTLTSGAFYYGLSRSAWAIAIAWVIFACQTGRGGPINKFLSWEFFFPLSRLTYCAYLVHPMVLMYYFFRLRSPIMLTGTFVTIHYLGFTVLSYGVAFITSLAFESPIIRLEKLLREGVKP